MKKFLSVLIAVFFAISLFFTFAISVVRFNVSRSAVKDFLCNFVQYSIDLSEIKVEPEFAQELIASEEVSEFMEKFGKDIYNLFTYTSSDINVTAKDVENLKEKVLALCEKYAIYDIDKSKVDFFFNETYDKYLTSYKEVVLQNNGPDETAVEILKILNFFLSLSFYLNCLGFTLIFAFLIILLNRVNLSWLKYISMSVFIVGVIVFISTLILQVYAKTSLSWMSDSYIMQDGLDNACRDYLLSVFFKMKVYGIVSVVLGYAFLTFEFIFKNKKITKN